MFEIERRKLIRKDEQLYLLEVILDKIMPGNSEMVSDLLKNEAFLLKIKYMNLPTVYLREDILDRNVCYRNCETKWMDGDQITYYINAKRDVLLRQKLRNKEYLDEEEEDGLLYLSYGGRTRASCLFQCSPSDVINSIKYDHLTFELYREKRIDDSYTSAPLPELYGTTETALDSNFLEMVKLCDIGKSNLPVVAELHATKVIRMPKTLNSITLEFTVKLTAFGKTMFCVPMIFVDKIKLIPEPQETDDEFEFLEEEVKKRILDEQERKKKMKEKVMTKIKFLDFPIMEIEQDEYKEPDIAKKKKVYKEWERNEDDDEDDEKNWMNELKEKMKQIEAEEKEKEEAKNRPPDPAIRENELLQEKIRDAELIGVGCYFSMIPVELSNAIKSHLTEIRVYLPGDAQNKKSKFIGEARITIDHTILDAIARACCPMIKVPVIGTMEKEVDIYSELEQRNSALMSLLIRIVCMGCTPWPQYRPIPRPIVKEPKEMEILLENLKALGPEGLARTCPLLKEHRVAKKNNLEIGSEQ